MTVGVPQKEDGRRKDVRKEAGIYTLLWDSITELLYSTPETYSTLGIN